MDSAPLDSALASPLCETIDGLDERINNEVSARKLRLLFGAEKLKAPDRSSFPNVLRVTVRPTFASACTLTRGPACSSVSLD